MNLGGFKDFILIKPETFNWTMKLKIISPQTESETLAKFNQYKYLGLAHILILRLVTNIYKMKFVLVL